MLKLATDNRDRIKSAIGVAAFHALIGYALLVGFGYRIGPVAADDMKIFDVVPEPPPPPPESEPPKATEQKKKPKTENPEGAASPKNLRDTPSPVVVPPPVIPLPVPSPIVAAPIAGLGNRDSAGASDVPGPGTGSGGQGTGTGSGDSGDGTGGGGGGGFAMGARWIKGSIRNADYPRGAVEAEAGGTVFLRFTVGTDGRVTSCAVTRSSGRSDLDTTTCNLIRKRFRYRPARDERGRPVPHVITGQHLWVMIKRPDGPMIEEEADDHESDDPHGP